MNGKAMLLVGGILGAVWGASVYYAGRQCWKKGFADGSMIMNDLHCIKDELEDIVRRKEAEKKES